MHLNSGNKNAKKIISKDESINFRCYKKDKQKWITASNKAGQGLSDWASEQLNKAAKG